MAKLGTHKRPIRFRAQTEERLKELSHLCDRNGWIFIGGFEPDKPEDIREVEYMLNPRSFKSRPRMAGFDSTTVMRENPKIGRNDPCPCGSGLKYKKCCMK